MRIIRIDEAITYFMQDTLHDLYDMNLTGVQVGEIEKILLTNISEYVQMYAIPDSSGLYKGIDNALRRTADTLTENSLCSVYEYDRYEGIIVKHRPVDIIKEYRKQTRVGINLNPYLAQYERI